MLKLMTSSAALAIGISSCPAFAQSVESSGEVGKVPDERSSDQLEEIVVTAQKRAEPLQRTPIAITAVTPETLDAQGIRNVQDLSTNIPNVVIAPSSSGGSTASLAFFIRGIGLEREGLAIEPAVGLYIDDIYYPRGVGAMLSVLDVERIEVLKGPQGTLFGKNTMAGAIRYVTREPDEERGGYIDITAGKFDHVDVRASVSMPVTQDLFLKVTAGSFNSDGYVKNVPTGKMLGGDHTNVVRGQLLWKPDENVKILASADYTESHNPGPPDTAIYINPNASNAAAWNRLNPGQPYDGRYASGSLYENYSNLWDYNLKGYGATLNVSWEVSDNLTIKSLSGYRKNKVNYGTDFDKSPLHIYETQTAVTIKSVSQELQLIGDALDGKIEYTGGLYYFKENSSSDVVTDVFNQFPRPYQSFSDFEAQSKAVFGQVSFEFLEGLKAILGARYAVDDKSIATATPARNLAGGNSKTFKIFTPKFGLQYQWTPNIMTYASASKGYRAGGFNSAANLGPVGFTPFDEELAWSYEAGAKTELFNRRLRVNAAAFHIDYGGLQLTMPILAPDGSGFNFLVGNVGTVKIDGLEVDTQLVLSRALTLGGSFGYLDGRYVDVGQVTSITPNSPLAGAPKYSYSLFGQYQLELPAGDSLTFRSDFGWKSSFRSYASDSFAVNIPSVGLLSGQIRYETSDGKVSIALQGRNITNRKYILAGQDVSRSGVPGLIGTRNVVPGRPAEYYATVSFRF